MIMGVLPIVSSTDSYRARPRAGALRLRERALRREASMAAVVGAAVA